ncbi:MAG: acylphosphatase [Lachnospiraceae bacterium]|nr:acylphosphatase [Lachnospiraceae bacterium]
MGNIIRRRYTFSGRVQGVGFRYRAYHGAQQLRLTGWVKNEWDGTVSMEVQGTGEEFDKLISLINKGTYVFIEKIYFKDIPLVSDERGFEVH